ncbi:MAG TPA: cation-translocating P-type ATPase [Candidatus Limnocylindria bacterium]|nr:cation-translocating P-type ATPase [Candidatus Limnocylindria bacterium]
MQVTNLLSLQDDPKHGPDCDDCGHDHGGLNHSHTNTKLSTTIVGLLFVLNSFVIGWISSTETTVADLSALIGVLILGTPILLVAFKDLRMGRLSINELVALGVLAAAATGDFRTAGIVAFFMLLGEIIETRTAAGARASIQSLIKLTPTKARRLVGKLEEEIPASDLKVGDVVLARPGDNIPADGVIISGQASINQANITGESLPVDKSVGDQVFAGTINLTGALEIKVTKAGQDTTLGRVRDLILAAERTKLPFMRIVDQYIGYYTPLVLVIAALVWGFTHDINRVITVLIGACPCAFILATPSAMVAALSAAARLGILVKNIADLEAAARINAFVFDKTGTLTSGKLVVSRLNPIGNIAPAELLYDAASAERLSNHPTAKALVQLANEAGLSLAPATDFRESAGKGVVATVEGRKLIIGRAAWLRDNGVVGDFLSSVDLNETEGFSLLFVARGNTCVGWIGLQDQVRPEAAEAIRELQAVGIRRLSMVSGDRKPVAERVAKEVGLDEVLAECLPQDKVEFVRASKAKGYRVAVIGDGVNDAPALAAGDISIAMGAAGSEVAINSATIALMNNDLRRLPFLIKLSRLTRTVINQNFLFGIVFVIVVLGAGSLGYIPPIVAAMLHNIGALFVVFNSARLVRQGEEMDPFLAQALATPPPTDSSATPPTGVPQPANA